MLHPNVPKQSSAFAARGLPSGFDFSDSILVLKKSLALPGNKG
jgi:hypothetical protein